MIEDSNPWKCDLARDTNKLKTRLMMFKQGSRRYPTGSLLYGVERYCLITAFVIRRLLEADKLSEELELTTIRVRAFRRRKRGYSPVDFMTKGDIEKRYILSSGVHRANSIAGPGEHPHSLSGSRAKHRQQQRFSSFRQQRQAFTRDHQV